MRQQIQWLEWKIKLLSVKGISMSELKKTVVKLRETGSIDLKDFQSLKVDELEALSEQIQYWCLYGNGKPEKLGE